MPPTKAPPELFAAQKRPPADLLRTSPSGDASVVQVEGVLLLALET